MKTYRQFFEDIKKRRQELLQRSKEQMQRFKEKSKAAADAQQEKIESERGREALKNEIKRELKNER
jgi:hypothetical protein